MSRRLACVLGGLALIVALVTPALSAAPAGATPTTFSFTGSVDTYTVPDGVTQVAVETWGAQGGTCSGTDTTGGLGGHVRATVTVVAGEVLNVRVGGSGGQLSGGFNGGGDGSADFVCAAGGGGATDVRQGGDAMSNRVVVAGGGGGNAVDQNGGSIAGSPGGGSTGGGGVDCDQGGGGTQTAGGAGGSICSSHDQCGGASGSAGFGGSGCGGGGGGGLFGGGSGSGEAPGDGGIVLGGGGGGSGFATSSALNVLNEAGIQSGDGSATITPVVPTAPRSLGVSAGNGQVTLTWQAPASGEPSEGYVVTPYISGVAQTPQSFPAAAMGATITGLTNATTYTFKVAAVNAVGAGPAATTVPVVVGAPSPPRLFAVRPGNGSAVLSWAPPANNGAAVSGYVAKVFAAGVLQSQWGFDATATTGTITGLTNGKTYTFTITATNARGVGLPASGAVTVGAPTAPGQPSAQPSSTLVTLSWAVPASNNGAAISGYVVVPWIGTAAETARTFNSAATTETITGLTNGTTYRFSVAAKNARGTGPSSAQSAAVLVGTPTAPRSPSATQGNQQATVSWIAPTDNGGFAITGYTVTPYLAGAAQQPRVYNSTAPTEVVIGLVNGKSYTFAVAARNARGTGPKSPQTAPLIVGTPSAPRTPSAAPGNSTAKISWTPPLTTNGAAITAYVITPYLGGVAQASRTIYSTATSETFTGLVNTKTYTFKVAGAERERSRCAVGRDGRGHRGHTHRANRCRPRPPAPDRPPSIGRLRRRTTARPLPSTS